MPAHELSELSRVPISRVPSICLFLGRWRCKACDTWNRGGKTCEKCGVCALCFGKKTILYSNGPRDFVGACPECNGGVRPKPEHKELIDHMPKCHMVYKVGSQLPGGMEWPRCARCNMSVDKVIFSRKHTARGEMMVVHHRKRMVVAI